MQGEIIEIVGRRSSGRTSVLLACLADVTRAGGIAALIDAADALDIESALGAGVELRRLLWVRCGQVRRQAALRAVDMLARCRGFSAIAWDVGDTPPRLPLTIAFRLKLAVRQSGAALLLAAADRGCCGNAGRGGRAAGHAVGGRAAAAGAPGQHAHGTSGRAGASRTRARARRVVGAARVKLRAFAPRRGAPPPFRPSPQFGKPSGSRGWGPAPRRRPLERTAPAKPASERCVDARERRVVQ